MMDDDVQHAIKKGVGQAHENPTWGNCVVYGLFRERSKRFGC